MFKTVHDPRRRLLSQPPSSRFKPLSGRDIRGHRLGRHIETIGIHDLHPSLDEVPDKLFLVAVLGVNLRRCAQLRVRAEHQVRASGAPLLALPAAVVSEFAKDSSQRAVTWLSANYLFRLLRKRSYGLLRSGAEAYSYPRTTCWRKSSRSGMDSNLEAFSYYPADCSFAALPGRTAAKTNYAHVQLSSIPKT